MQLLNGKYNWFLVTCVVTLMAFFFFRPVNDPTQRIIAADGLGYYAYLPARFIYNDAGLNFNWFDAVFNQEYNNHLFEKPTENFMVAYRDKAINKYYPGQSLLQLPFFLVAHLAARLFNYPANGFSLPYQLAMGLAAIFYTLFGLLFLFKLLSGLFEDKKIATLVPILIFFGTNLFTYTVFMGCYSHACSFCILTLVYYFAFRFFNVPEGRLFYLLLTLLFSVIAVSIRPFNLLLLFGVFYFYKPLVLKEIRSDKCRWIHLLLLVGIAGVLFYNLEIIYTQTKSLLINSYSGERFYFDKWQHVADNLIGFQYGILWYTPLIFICFGALIVLRKKTNILFLLIPLLLMIMLYSFWWYWNIVSRVIVDSSVITAILLCHVLLFFKQKAKTSKYLIAGAILCAPFFQLKAYQLRQNILDNNYTYAKYYFKHFFTLKPVHVYPVNPAAIKTRTAYFQDFESQSGSQVTSDDKFEGVRSALLDSKNEYACTSTYNLPAFFANKGYKKIKAAFWMKVTPEADNIHLVFKFSRRDSSLAYLPFYIQKAGSNQKWKYYEFGTDLPAAVEKGDSFSIYFWNPDHKDRAYIDNLKLEFFLTDGSDEVTLE